MSTQEIECNLESAIAHVLSRDVVNRHSYFQLKYFVVGKEHTNQSRMWCCIRELQARQQSIQAMKIELDSLADEKELIEIDIDRIAQFSNESERTLSSLDTKEKEVLTRKKQRAKLAFERQIENIQKKLKEAFEEATFFVQAFASLEKLEPLKPYDDLESQINYWNEKLSQEVYLRTLLHKPLDVELVKTILSLKDDMPIKQDVINMLEQQRLASQETKKITVDGSPKTIE